jgi:hypothetical protein
MKKLLSNGQRWVIVERQAAPWGNDEEGHIYGRRVMKTCRSQHRQASKRAVDALSAAAVHDMRRQVVVRVFHFLMKMVQVAKQTTVRDDQFLENTHNVSKIKPWLAAGGEQTSQHRDDNWILSLGLNTSTFTSDFVGRPSPYEALAV